MDPEIEKLEKDLQAAYDEKEILRRIEQEADVEAFMKRTGLAREQVIMIRFPSGIFEPHWRGVFPQAPEPFSATPCPECGRQH